MLGEIGLNGFGDFWIFGPRHGLKDRAEEFDVFRDVGGGHEGKIVAPHSEDFFYGRAIGAEEFLCVEFKGLGFGPIGLLAAVAESVEEPGAHVKIAQDV